MKKILLKSLVAGITASLMVHIPFIGLFFAFLALPLMLVVPELGTSGVHVEIGFAWLSLKSTFAWIAFVGYFSLLAMLFFWVLWHFKSKRDKKIP